MDLEGRGSRTPAARRPQGTRSLSFDRHWRRDIADAYDLAPVPAFMARGWGEYALARDPKTEARVHALEDEANAEADFARAKALIEEAGQIRREAAKAKPGH
ncbi:hypothetical protein ACFXKR_30840 [Streptomyces violascens]|uniref:hypothetical protein n=1 Tax=Streptomyces violascens TaxID=67381 RepID=UPI0036A96C7D